MLYVVYTASNVEECFFVCAWPSRASAKNYVNNSPRKGHLFIVEQDYSETIEPEIK
jgi:hypothetical protein